MCGSKEFSRWAFISQTPERRFPFQVPLPTGYATDSSEHLDRSANTISHMRYIYWFSHVITLWRSLCSPCLLKPWISTFGFCIFEVPHVQDRSRHEVRRRSCLQYIQLGIRCLVTFVKASKTIQIDCLCPVKCCENIPIRIFA